MRKKHLRLTHPHQCSHNCRTPVASRWRAGVRRRVRSRASGKSVDSECDVLEYAYGTHVIEYAYGTHVIEYDYGTHSRHISIDKYNVCRFKALLLPITSIRHQRTLLSVRNPPFRGDGVLLVKQKVPRNHKCHRHVKTAITTIRETQSPDHATFSRCQSPGFELVKVCTYPLLNESERQRCKQGQAQTLPAPRYCDLTKRRAQRQVHAISPTFHGMTGVKQ